MTLFTQHYVDRAVKKKKKKRQNGEGVQHVSCFLFMIYMWIWEYMWVEQLAMSLTRRAGEEALVRPSAKELGMLFRLGQDPTYNQPQI